MKKAKSEYSDNFSYLLRLLACVLNDTHPPKPESNTDWASVWSLAKFHSVAGMVSYALQKLPPDSQPPADIMKKFKNSQCEQLVVEANVQVETDRLLAALSEAGVRTLPVKGILLKQDYPAPSMRTMSDVDILYDVSYREQLKAVFSDFGYTLTHDKHGDLDFIKEPFFHYELHSEFLSPDKRSYEYFREFRKHIIYPEDSFVGHLSVDDTYIYLLEHLAKHLEGGGAGIRLIMDVYVFNKAHGAELDTAYLSDRFKELSLTKFSVRIRELAFNWFGGDDPDTDTELADFILCCGTFGISRDALMQNAIRTENVVSKKQSGFSRIMRKIFPSYSSICGCFHSARKFKLLYPFYIPAYWFIRVFRYRNVNTANLKYYFTSTDSDTASRIRRVIESLGLSDRM